MQIHVWSTWLDVPENQVEICWKLLGPDERQRAARFHFHSDRIHFVVARGVLRMLLGKYLGIAGSEVRLDYGPFGKPELSMEHKSDIRFNLAHSGSLGLYAFARSQSVGVDVEVDRVDSPISTIADDSFTTTERLSLGALPANQRTSASLMLWTRKEAYVKALGHGLQQEPSSFEMSVPPQMPALMRGTNQGGTNQDEYQSHWFFCDLQPSPNYVGTLCAEQAVQTRFWSWKLD